MALKWQMLKPAAKRTYTVKIYSDPGHGLNSVDGGARRWGWFKTWNDIRNGPGVEASPDGGSATASIQAETLPWPLWHMIQRSIMTFYLDPALIPPGLPITRAVYWFYVIAMYDEIQIDPTFGLVESHPIDPNNLVPADYQNLDSTPISTILSYTHIINEWRSLEILPEYLSLLVSGQVLKLGLREMKYDAANIEPAWLPWRISGVEFWTVDSGDPDKRPYLEVTVDP
jgi:hypothetical protein